MPISFNRLNVVIKRVNKVNKKRLAALMLCLELLIFYADYLTGPLAPFSHFYIIPIIIAAFFLGSRWTYFITFLASIAELMVFQQLLISFNSAPAILDFISNTFIFFTIAILSRELSELLATLDRLASEDTLTKANSGRYFYDAGNAEIARSLRYKHPLTLAFIDLDNFKEVNDTQGHQKGDELLMLIASAIKSDLREGDLLGRLGGDEFAILLVHTDQIQAMTIIGRMTENLLNSIAPYNTRVTFSMGAVTYMGDKQSNVDELITIADTAMYSIKKTTKNAIHYVIA